MNLEDEIKDTLGFKRLTKIPGKGGGGDISHGEAYETDDEQRKRVFVKFNAAEKAMLMFEGEYSGLITLKATDTVRVPDPFGLVRDPATPGGALIMEFLDMGKLAKYQDKLGEDVAGLHLHNEKVDKKYKRDVDFVGKSKNNEPVEYVEEFGFDVVTCCGAIEMVNEWTPDWVSFYARHRLDVQLKLVEEKYSDREVSELWSELQIKVPKYFKDLEEKGVVIKPSLLHGDLWGGNAGETEEGPVVFDPASFYGHNEFELALTSMFGGFRRPFFDAYHSLIKRTSAFDKRQDLYQLFHYLNHWNHFGNTYKDKSVSLMKKLVKI